MNILGIIAVFFGGGLGSICRFGISRLFLSVSGFQKLPLATLITNVLACVVMLVVIYITGRHRTVNECWSMFWLIGFCGGFSTFSTFSYENWLLYRQASYGIFALNIVLSIGLCLAVFIIAGKNFSVSGG